MKTIHSFMGEGYAHCCIVDRTIKVGKEFLHIVGVQNVYVLI
jgi:hypothetical protein